MLRIMQSAQTQKIQPFYGNAGAILFRKVTESKLGSHTKNENPLLQILCNNDSWYQSLDWGKFKCGKGLRYLSMKNNGSVAEAEAEAACLSVCKAYTGRCQVSKLLL